MLYSLGMKDFITKTQLKVLKALTSKVNDFYLGGGTALSLYYFHHRKSIDLDFFSHKLSRLRIEEIIKLISTVFKKHPKLIGQQLGKGKVKMLVYSFSLSRDESFKIDFIEDYLKLINPIKTINGIKVLSLEDIYQRKILAVTGTSLEIDTIGRRFAKGGREEAKDFYDLFCLSQIFMPLSKFSLKYGTPIIRELLVRWFHSYGRFEMKAGLKDLELKKDINYSDIERHFKQEIEKILEEEVE